MQLHEVIEAILEVGSDSFARTERVFVLGRTVVRGIYDMYADNGTFAEELIEAKNTIHKCFTGLPADSKERRRLKEEIESELFDAIENLEIQLCQEGRECLDSQYSVSYYEESASTHSTAQATMRRVRTRCWLKEKSQPKKKKSYLRKTIRRMLNYYMSGNDAFRLKLYIPKPVEDKAEQTNPEPKKDE